MAAREREEFTSIVAGIGGHRAQLAFEEQMLFVVQRWDVAEVDARDGQRATAVERLEGGQHQIADGREQDGGIQQDRRANVRTLRRRRAQCQRQLARGDTSRHDVHLGALRKCDLRGDVCAAPEPVNAKPPTRRQVGTQQGAIADDACTQQWRQFGVRVTRGQRVRESRWNRGEFGVTPVGVPTGVARLRAQVLLSTNAELAYPAGMAQPCDADTITDPELAVGVRSQRNDLTNDLVPRYDVLSVNRQIPLSDMQIRAAHTTCVYSDEELTRSRQWHGYGDAFQRIRAHRAGPADPPRAHRRTGSHHPMVTQKAYGRRIRPYANGLTRSTLLSCVVAPSLRSTAGSPIPGSR